MTYEQMEQFDPMDRYDIEVEQSTHEEEEQSNHKKPFSPSIQYYERERLDDNE